MCQNKCIWCNAEPIKAEQWMTVISTSIHLWVSLGMSYNLLCVQQLIVDRNKKSGNVKKWKRKQSYTKMKLMWQCIEFWGHASFIVSLYHYGMAFTRRRFLRFFNFLLGLCSRYYYCHYHCYCWWWCCCCCCRGMFLLLLCSLDWMFLLCGASAYDSHSHWHDHHLLLEMKYILLSFVQTILPVNYLIKWNGCFKY